MGKATLAVTMSVDVSAQDEDHAEEKALRLVTHLKRWLANYYPAHGAGADVEVEVEDFDSED